MAMRMKRLRNAKMKTTANVTEHKLAMELDDLAEFREFRDEVLPVIRKDIKAGLTAEAIYTKYQTLAAARGVNIALTTQDPKTALTAIKEILDRVGGKAVERVAVKHRFEKLNDNELDSLLESRVREVEEADTDEQD